MCAGEKKEWEKATKWPQFLSRHHSIRVSSINFGRIYRLSMMHSFTRKCARTHTPIIIFDQWKRLNGHRPPRCDLNTTMQHNAHCTQREKGWVSQFQFPFLIWSRVVIKIYFIIKIYWLRSMYIQFRSTSILLLCVLSHNHHKLRNSVPRTAKPFFVGVSFICVHLFEHVAVLLLLLVFKHNLLAHSSAAAAATGQYINVLFCSECITFFMTLLEFIAHDIGIR